MKAENTAAVDENKVISTFGLRLFD